MLMKRLRVAVGAALLAITVTPVVLPSPAGAAAGEVLILAETVTGGAGSTLAQKFVAAGKTPVVVDSATWSGMTAAEFDAYDAIVLGDPTCASTPPAAAEANAATWSSVVDGNVVIIGTDETFHQTQGGAALMEKAAAFTVAEAGTTGAYISLSCYYHGTAANTPIPMLAGLGTFTATGVACHNDAHIVATHPALSGLTDADLSNWSCSVHEGFDAWPSLEYEVLAIAERADGNYTAPDGSVGFPYILARGVDVISDITLAPEDDTNPVGSDHTLTATVMTDDPDPDTPVVGTTVTFEVVAGPHAGVLGTDVTDGSGVATIAYTGTTTGTDTIEARFVDAFDRTQRSNRVTKTWVDGGGDGQRVSGTKFYDADTDGVQDAGEVGIGDWLIDVTDPSGTQTVITDADGGYSAAVEEGTVEVAEQLPAGWIQTGPDDGFYEFDVAANQDVTGLDFGNVCVGDGGARTKGFWQNRNGEALFETDNDGALAMLEALNLRDEDGEAFDPEDYSELRNWIRKARAGKNAAYMLSAQLASMALNVHFELVDPDAHIQADGADAANAAGFATVQDILDEADAALAADGETPPGDEPNRSDQLLLSGIIDAANNNQSFVQAGPDDCAAPFFGLAFSDDFNAENGGDASLNYSGFANWDVTDGTVDIIGNGTFDFFPGEGLFVDLDGSTSDSGVLETQMAFPLLDGGTYRLTFDLAGSQRGTAESVDVTLGTVYAETFPLASADPLATITRDIVITASELATLSFENAGGDNIGAILDNVTLNRIA